ncbi:hypothetical protein Tco_1387937 [Tanacetum coccineum]
MENIFYRHQQVLNWQRNWNAQDSSVMYSNPLGHEDTQVYGTILPKDLTNQAMLESKAYKTYYAFASGEKNPKPKYIRKKADSDTSPNWLPKEARHNFTALTQVAQVMELTLSQRFLMSKHLKMTSVDEGTGTIPGVPDAPIYESESEKESWGDSGEEDKDDENDYDHKSDGNDDDDANDDDNQEGDDTNGDDEETDKEDNEVTKELYDDVNVNLGNKDTDMTKADQGASEQQNISQESGFEQVEEDAHVKLTPVLDTQKADEPVQSSYVSSNFTRKLLNLENPSPADNEIASLLDTTARHATIVPEITSSFTTAIPPPPSFFNPLIQQATPTPKPTTFEATTSFPSLLDFSYVFRFNERVTNLEKDLSEIKQVDQYAQALSSIPGIVDRYIDNKLGEVINKAIRAHNLDCRQEAQDDKNAYIELVDISMRAIIKEEVNTQLPQILPQAVSDFANPMIEKNVTESLEAAVLTRFSSQPKSTYEAAASLSEFELTKILLDKMEESKSHLRADYKRKL